jgi:peptidoglycan hydrolase-like protein with peptidoglycan-binding domain
MGYVTPADVGISDNWQDHKDRDSAEPGTDYVTDYGTDCRIAGDGVVQYVDNSNGGAEGRRLQVNMDNGEVIDYIHGSWIDAHEGQRVSRGQTGIFYSGASGFGEDWYYGPHVHVTRRLYDGGPYWDTVDFEDAVGGGGSGEWPARELYGEHWVYWAQGLLGITQDGYDGPETQDHTRNKQSSNGLEPDGIFGPATATPAYRDAGSPLVAPGFPLPDGSYYFGPADGGDKSISGYYGYSNNLKCWQQRMADRGWGFSSIDGLYGNETKAVAEGIQAQEGLTVDGLIGPSTWATAWTSEVK